MSASFVIRFDDICPTMNWEMWRGIEEVLTDFGVKPVVAVVPDNQDPFLEVGPANPRFWDEVRGWQSKGWTIALHGFRHLPSSTDSGIVGLNPKSEFAGLPHDEQLEKLTEAVQIFKSEGIEPGTWIAPSHSFDRATVKALREIGITRISDGLFLYPHTDAGGTLWVPQQLWRFYPMPFGVWTVCCHHNSWTGRTFQSFRDSVERYKRSIVTFDQAAQSFHARRNSIADSLASRLLLSGIRLKRCAGSMLGRGA